MNAGEKLNLLDVREDNERAEFNIGGVHLSLGKIQMMQVELVEAWKDEEIIVYCRSGNRSGTACLYLEHLGFKGASNLAGGMLAWKEIQSKR